MIYVVSDIHGEYMKYKKMLDTIKLKDSDTLYVLGDVIDRGPDGLKILQDMMMRVNVIPILGNHEYMAATAIPWLLDEITDKTIASFSEDRIKAISEWMTVGGDSTLRELTGLSREEKEDILDYLEEFSLFEEVEAGGRSYILVHAGLKNFSPDRDLEDYDISELIFETPDFLKKYFNDKVLITGHTPTAAIRARYTNKPVKDCSNDVLGKNNHLAIDCGCAYGGKLACVCLDNLKVYYF